MAQKILEALARLGDAPGQGQILDGPEAGNAECCLGARQAVARRHVAIQQTVRTEPVLNEIIGTDHAGIIGLPVPAARGQQQARIRRRSVELGHICVQFPIETVAFDRGFDCGALSLKKRDGHVQLTHRRQFQQTVERDPAHDLRMRVMLARTARLPYSVVRLAPKLAHLAAEAGKTSPLPRIELTSALDELTDGLNHGPVDVELQLLMRRIADAHGAGAAITLEVSKLDLPQARFAEYVVDDLETGPSQPRRVQKPVDEKRSLTRIADIDKSLESQRRVAQPTEAVVPIAHATGDLRQRGRGGPCPGRS